MPFFAMDIVNIKPGDLDLISGYCHKIGYAGIENQEHKIRLTVEGTDVEKLSQIEAILHNKMSHLETVIHSDPIIIENWQDNWKDFFQPVQVGSFVVLPPWERPFEDLIPIIINPKMAFGTGTHESTQIVLEMMNMENMGEKKVLDVGCGSGILSIAAAKLKANNVLGIDIDPLAIENANENAELNKIDRTIFDCNTPEKLDHDEFDVIIANIVKNVLVEMSQSFSQLLSAGGKLFLSGLLEDEVKPVLSTYEELGFYVESTSSKNEWRMLILSKGKQ